MKTTQKNLVSLSEPEQSEKEYNHRKGKKSQVKQKIQENQQSLSGQLAAHLDALIVTLNMLLQKANK